MSDFQQTVDLREKAEQRKKYSGQIEHIYSQMSEDNTKKKLQKIDRPTDSNVKLNSRLIHLVVFILAFLIVSFVIHNLFFKDKSFFNKSSKSPIWYAVKLVNNETFYGQIENTKADPIVMANVYYNYDQDKNDQKETSETGNLRLVKRGKETHGPVGAMDLVRSQVLFMEPLSDDSKVLKAILEYEN